MSSTKSPAFYLFFIFSSKSGINTEFFIKVIFQAVIFHHEHCFLLFLKNSER